jgi:threonine aldolase
LDPIDLRSDTVSRPSAAMRAAMAEAEVGDDVYGEDPTVNRLEERSAALMGKPAALFVPSGTMANQIAIRAQTRPGDVVLTGEGAHVLLYESGGAAALSGVQIETVGRGGFFDGAERLAAMPPRDIHKAPATLVALENTHNVSGGRVWPPDQRRRVVETARERGLRVHLDGARIFNAACASGEEPARIAAGTDTVSFCLSKGLGAPVGSLLCGDRERVAEMRRLRKMYGGGMRQAGILAAAGLYALEHNVGRLQEDHANARALAEGLEELGLEVERRPETNILVFGIPERRFRDVPDAPAFSRLARAHDVWINPIDRRRLRAVTHIDVPRPRIAEVLDRIRSFLRALAE